MSEITKQKGASSSTPSPFMRWFSSKLMNYISSEKRQLNIRKKREAKRRKQGRSHVVEYFHQVDDGYSHLAIQILAKLKTQYDIDLIIHFVPPAQGDNFPEPELWKEISLADAKRVAPYYALDFDSSDNHPDKELVQLASSILCHLNTEQTVTEGVKVSNCLWRNDRAALESMALKYGYCSPQEVNSRYESGKARRRELKHYHSAMFYYEGEWYWGIDRLYHLESRLKCLGAVVDSGLPPVALRPGIPNKFDESAENLTLEFYVSLRSPYTAIAWDPTLKLAKDSGVNLVVKPVLPMVMRGVPATREKKIYIAIDAAREARTLNVEYGNFYDPIGEPVLRGYSLYMWALEKHKGNDLLGAFLKAAFAKGINCNTSQGLQKVLSAAGLDWKEAQQHISKKRWQELLERNRLSMYHFGCWGVPSYRLLDEDKNEVMSAWGQDRLWLVAQKIRESCKASEVPSDTSGMLP